MFPFGTAITHAAPFLRQGRLVRVKRTGQTRESATIRPGELLIAALFKQEHSLSPDLQDYGLSRLVLWRTDTQYQREGSPLCLLPYILPAIRKIPRGTRGAPFPEARTHQPSAVGKLAGADLEDQSIIEVRVREREERLHCVHQPDAS